MSLIIRIRVLEANTGTSHPIGLPSNDLSVKNIKHSLVDIVPLKDQILLLGPPYKVPKDSTLRSEETLSALRLGDLEDDPNYYETTNTTNNNNTHTNADQQQNSTPSPTNTPTPSTRRRKKRILSTTERSGARRLFLFSKRSLSESAPDPTPCILQPTTVALPTEPDPSPISFPTTHNPSSSTMTTATSASTISATSPLHKALQVYERQFMLHLNRGQTLTATSHLRLQSLQTCLAEQTVISLALRAAVSNLSDHRNGAARTSIDLDSEYGRKCGVGSREYKMLQDGELDRVLDELGNVPLHTRLVDLARGSGRRMETLVDTVMVERERNWWMRCREGHAGLKKLYNEVTASFGYLVNVGVVGTEDSEEEEKIEALVDEVEGNARDLRDEQVERLDRLAADHRRAVNVVLDAIGSGSTGEGEQKKAEEGGYSQSQSDGEKGQRAFIVLEEMSKASQDILPQMEQDDAALLEIMDRVANHKTDSMKRMKIRLRQVSVAQSAIQKVLSQVSVLREALDRWCVDVAHLEHVQELPTAYGDFISEVIRRRAYGEAVAATAGAMIERLAYVRDEEVKMRERFLKGAGRHLMPPFFEVFVPTLVSAPPLFAPQFPAMVEMDTLPDFGSLEKTEADGVRRASGGGITVPSLSPDDDVAGTTSDASMENSSPIDGSGAGNDNAETNTSDSVEERQALIVSADPTSTSGNYNDVIMGGIDSSHDAADKSSNQKMLAYENSVLRQALERMGGKAPRIYFEEAHGRDRQKRDEEHSASINLVQAQLDESRKEVTQYKTNLDRANAALHELQNISLSSPRQCDKISHSNIKVGDVALFMPTSAREKRDYLAFHSNCPRKYLNTDSIEGNPDYVLGRIVIQEKLVAGAKGTDANPYGLKPGTTFWVLTVEVIKVQVPNATSAATNVSS